MKRASSDDRDVADLDALVEGITAGARGDDEKLRAFRRAFEESIAVPCDAFVIGEPVSLIEFGYDGNERRGLTARCRREDGSEHAVAACDVLLPPRSSGARHVAAYRKWLGLEPFLPESDAVSRAKRQHKAAPSDIDLGVSVELVALSIKQNTARCRLLGSDRVITLRASLVWDVVPGAIVVVKPRKQWSYAGHPYLSGEIESTRLDAAALDLVPLVLEDQGLWTPEEHYWGEEGEPIGEWAKPIIARGPRQMFEMEQVVPGRDGDDDPSASPTTSGTPATRRRHARS
jgi:hypothetical protein